MDIIEDKIRAQELENTKINKQKNNLNKTLSQEKQKTALLEKDLQDCKQEIQKYFVDLAELNKAVKELEDIKIKITQDHSKEIEKLRGKSECAIKWCGALDQHVQDFFLFSAHIAENWKERNVENLNLAKVASDLCDFVKYTTGLFKPGVMGTMRDFKQPAWLTKR